MRHGVRGGDIIARPNLTAKFTEQRQGRLAQRHRCFNCADRRIAIDRPRQAFGGWRAKRRWPYEGEQFKDVESGKLFDIQPPGAGGRMA